MSVFQGTFSPPVSDPLCVVLPIGGKGRCEISGAGLVCEGFKAGTPVVAALLALAAALAVGLGAYFGNELGVFDLSLSEIGAAVIFTLLGVGVTAGTMRARNTKPQRYAVGLTGVKSVERVDERSQTVRILVPGIKRRAAIYFRPEQGAGELIRAFQQQKQRTRS